MYKEDFVLNSIQWLICHKTKPIQIIYIYIYTCVCVCVCVCDGLGIK